MGPVLPYMIPAATVLTSTISLIKSVILFKHYTSLDNRKEFNLESSRDSPLQQVVRVRLAKSYPKQEYKVVYYTSICISNLS